MNENALIRTDENGTIIPDGQALANIPTTSIEDFQRDALVGTTNRLSMASMRSSSTDTAMHIGLQLKSEDVVNHVLTISHVSFASIPAQDVNGTPIYDENGNQKTSIYPVCRFKEAPAYWYNGGTMLRKNIEAWCNEVGEDMNDLNLPKVNEVLEEVGGVRVYFSWKNKRGSAGTRYVNMIVA